MQTNIVTSAPFVTEVKSLQESLRSQNNPTTVTEAAQSTIASSVQQSVSQKSNANANITQITGKGSMVDLTA
jgi:hypothetical protein